MKHFIDNIDEVKKKELLKDLHESCSEPCGEAKKILPEI